MKEKVTHLGGLKGTVNGRREASSANYKAPTNIIILFTFAHTIPTCNRCHIEVLIARHEGGEVSIERQNR